MSPWGQWMDETTFDLCGDSGESIFPQADQQSHLDALAQARKHAKMGIEVVKAQFAQDDQNQNADLEKERQVRMMVEQAQLQAEARVSDHLPQWDAQDAANDGSFQGRVWRGWHDSQNCGPRVSSAELMQCLEAGGDAQMEALVAVRGFVSRLAFE